MKKLFLLFLLVSGTFANAQSKRIATQIGKLNNAQFNIHHDKKSSFSVKSSPAQKLIRFGKPANAQLMEALKDPDKTIMAHYTLCHIYFKHVSFAGPKEASKGDVTVYKYYLGEEKGEGLIISEIKNGSNYSVYIEPADLEKIQAYWKTKTGQ